jgi:hypothetical protein
LRKLEQVSGKQSRERIEKRPEIGQSKGTDILSFSDCHSESKRNDRSGHILRRERDQEATREKDIEVDMEDVEMICKGGKDLYNAPNKNGKH